MSSNNNSSLLSKNLLKNDYFILFKLSKIFFF